MTETAAPRYLAVTDRDASTMMEARALLAQAIARLDALSDIDQERLVYLEQRKTDLEQQSQDNRATAQDLFHTANNALYIVSVNIELLTRHASMHGTCGHDVAKWLGLMSQKIDEVALTNRQLLAASISGTGPLYLIHSYISFRAVIQRALDVYENVAREKNIRISWDLPEFPAITIWTDGVAIGTVLDNLLSNAIKFSPPGTSIHVTMRRAGKELICTVRDEGPGMSAEDVAMLFQRGAPLEPRPTGGESSSGYGLAIAHDVIKSLGGRIWCESEKGTGTSFMFALPTDVRAEQV
ncbi:MAG TPA: HAMP domain-containing sensor histidine kinase [Thermoanaerobaculia bacterium]|nr:HAMP domain-containing sensor histidine kinase [Thermoanaerobaculia bacterium]